jgi:hypothetical protein
MMLAGGGEVIVDNAGAEELGWLNRLFSGICPSDEVESLGASFGVSKDKAGRVGAVFPEEWL